METECRLESAHRTTVTSDSYDLPDSLAILSFRMPCTVVCSVPVSTSDGTFRRRYIDAHVKRAGVIPAGASSGRQSNKTWYGAIDVPRHLPRTRCCRNDPGRQPGQRRSGVLGSSAHRMEWLVASRFNFSIIPVS